MARIAIMALEGLEEEEVAVGTDIPVEEIADQPENDLAEMQEIATEMESGEDSIDEAADTADTLGEVQDQMAETLPEGGMEPAAAAAVEVAVEHMCKRLGFSAKQSGFALEAFGDKTTRVQATKIAMETIGEQIKKIWDAIVAAFKKAIAWVVSFYDKLFDGAAKLAKRAATVAAAAETKIKENATLQKDAKVTKGLTNQLNFTKYLVKGNKFMTGAEIIDACKKLTEMDGSFLEGKAIFLLKSAGPMQPGKVDASKLTTHIDSYLNSLGLKEKTGNSKVKAPERMSLYERELPFGNFSIYSYNTSDTSGENAATDIGKIKMFIDTNTEKENTGTLSEAPFELRDISTSAKSIESHLGKYSGLRTLQAELKKEQESVQAEAEKASKAEGVSDDEKKGVMVTAAFVRAQISLTSSALSAIRSYDINACKSVLDYASKSLGNYAKAA